jgi:ornithine cyclodeaminase
MAIILTQNEVRRLLPMRECIDVMTAVLQTLGRGDAVNPLRWVMRLPREMGLLGLMPGYLGEPKSLGLKVVSIFPHNEGSEYDSHQGIVLLVDPETAVPIAVMDASEITAIRTAAVTGVATRLLAREDASVLAILGSGVQARTHLEAMLLVRQIREVRVFSPTAANREAFAGREGRRHDVAVRACPSARAAVEGAEIVCAVTSSREPVVAGDWLDDGVHINAVGSSVPQAREIDTAAVARSRLFVDSRESALHEAGDFLIARREGAVGDEHILAEIGEVLLGEHPGRGGSGEVTLFKSLGLAVEDLAAADHVLRRAVAEGVGTEVDLGGRRHAPD